MTMADGVNWQAVLTVVQAGKAQAAAGYIDGKDSEWPAEAWAKFSVPLLTISVEANPEAMSFDVEAGDASPARVSTAVAERAVEGLPSVIYCRDTTGLAVTWLAVTQWPRPGAYMWAAGGHPGTPAPDWCPVAPVAVQDRYLGAYDLSTLKTGWLPRLGPAPLTEEELMSLTSDGAGGCYAVGKGNGRTTDLLHVTPSTTDLSGWSIVDVTAAVKLAHPADPAFTVAP